MQTLEQVIGYTFRDPALLQLALTHGSIGYENQRAQADNQRLEFLGDAVLQLSLSDLLFHRLHHGDEGVLTQARAQLGLDQSTRPHCATHRTGCSLAPRPW